MDQIVVFRCSHVLRQVVLLWCALVLPAVANAQTATTTTLTVSPSNSPLQPKTMVTLTATVMAGSTPVYPGRVTFCDATAAHCIGIAVLGTAQLTTSGTATLRFVPGPGSHSYNAVFAGTTTPTAYAASTSTTAPVTALAQTTTTITSSGSAGNYTLTATVVGRGNPPPGPTGSVTFVDTTNGNHVLGTATLGPATRAQSFVNATGSPVPVGTSPQSLAVGDFNGDGIVDLAVPNVSSNNVSILLGKGDGTFAPATSVTVGSQPRGVAVGDFNGDGFADLAVANGSVSATTVSILRGNGDGTFAPATSVTVGTSPRNVVVGDFNGDGIADLAVTNADSNNLSILLGNGNGTFTQASGSPIGLGITISPWGVAVGDFNHDGITDLVVASAANANASVLLGNGDGTFQTPSVLTIGAIVPYFVTVGDFNGDGIADLVMAYSGSAVGILLGNGDGTFQPATSFAVGSQPRRAAVGDFNDDGITDLAVANAPAGSVSILLGNGNGTFAEASGSPITVGANPYAVAVGDFDGDGTADLAVPNLGSNNTNILLNEVTWTATATLTGVSIPGTGAHEIEGQYPGDTNNAESTSPPITLEASPVNTDTNLQLSAYTITFGEPVTLIAYVKPLTESPLTMSGVVDFLLEGNLLGSATINAINGSGEAILVVNGSPIPNFPAGTHNLTAVYHGDPNFNTSASQTATLTVNTVLTGVELFSSQNPSIYGQPVTFKAVLPNDATGTIQFEIGGAPLNGPVPISGGAAETTISTLPAGAHPITAVYNGDANHGPATGTLEQLVEPALLTVTATSTSRVFGQLNPPFAYNITGFVLGETQSIVSGTPLLTTLATELSPVGSFPIVVGHGTLSASNYTFAFVNGILTIAQATPGTGGTPAVSVSSAPNPSMWGEDVTLTATVPPNATGTVTFMEGSTTLGTGTIVSNQAQFSTTHLAVGTHHITAVYGGDTNFTGASSAAHDHVVNKATLSVTANDAERPFGQPNPTFTATITGFVIGDTASVLAGAPSLTTTATETSPVGTYPITAAIGTLAAENYSFTFHDGTLLITSITPSITITSSANPSPVGGAVTFTVTVPAGATGTVNFLSGETLLGTATITGNTATFTTSTLTAGIHSITAVYTGDANHNAASSAALSQVITAATVTLSSSVNPQVLGLPVTFSAVIIPTPEDFAPPTGTVTFSEGGTVLGTGTINGGGIATFTTSSLIEGTHTITATYSGDANYPQATGSLDQVIVASMPGTIEPGAGGGGNDQTAVYGNAFAQPLSVVVMQSGAPAAGVTVTFVGSGLNFSSGGTVTTDSNGIASVTATGTQVGGFVATATTPGIDQTVSFALSVTPAPLTVTANNATRPFGAANPAFTGTYAGAVFGNTFTVSGTTTAVLNSPAGTYPITPTISGPALGNYTVTKVNGTLTVTKVGGSVTLDVPTTPSQPGGPVTLTATVPPGATGTVTFYDGTTALGTATIVNGTATLTITLAVGTHTITAVYNGDANFTAATSAPISLVINSAADFDVSSPTPPQLIPPGASAGFAIHIPSVGAPYNSPVTLTASGLPAGATYTFSPNPVTPGASGINSTLTINVPRQSAMLERSGRTALVLAVLLMPFALLRRARGRPHRLLLWVLVALASFVTLNGCGTGGYFSQPQRTYIITVTGTSGTLVHSTTVTLTVQ